MIKETRLLESIADFQLGNITSDEWLQKLADIEECVATCSISWTTGDPRTYVVRTSRVPTAISSDWLIRADQILRQASPDNLGLLSDIAKSVGMTSDDPKNLLNDPNLMIACLDPKPIVTLLVLRCDHKPEGWSENDRNHFRQLLPGLQKAHELHKLVILAGNKLDIANTIIGTTPHGIIGLTPNARVIRANKMAQDLLNAGDCLALVDGRLKLLDSKVSKQFEQQLAKIRAMPLGSLCEVIWNRSLPNTGPLGLHQFVLRAYPYEARYLESNPNDRFLVLKILTPQTITKASAAELTDFYGLTRAQARVVEYLLLGKSITATSNQLGVSVHTVRSHLQQIYSKLNVNKQSDLMRLLAMTLVNYEPIK